MEAYKPIVDKAVAYGNAHEGSTEEKVEKTVDKMFVLFGAEILKVVIFFLKKIWFLFFVQFLFNYIFNNRLSLEEFQLRWMPD